MINKAVGYSGFRTYGQLPYPTRKQGKQLQLANKVWQSTVKPIDHTHPLQNYHNNKTVYKKSYLQNTQPQHYHPQHVPRGGNKTLGFQNSGIIKAYDREQAQKYNKLPSAQNVDDPRKANLLKTGTQHWRSIYQQSVSGANQGNNGLSSIAYNRQNLTNNGLTNGAQQGKIGNTYLNQNNINNIGANGTLRSNSVGGGRTNAQIAQQMARQNSYKTKPYINNAKTGVSDYKFNYGQKIGSSPLDLMDMVSIKQPLIDHPLKRGTNQLWTQIPNYQGFKPSELPFKQYQQKINNRGVTNKGNLKLQTAQNFLVQTPGYGGFKPQFQNTSGRLRQSCLSTKFGG